MHKLRVGLDEILPSKTAARTLPQVIDRLERGEADHFVITRRNKPRAVLVTYERYESLVIRAEGVSLPTSPPVSDGCRTCHQPWVECVC